MLFTIRDVQFAHLLSAKHIDIEAGSFVVLRGPSGGGKTTLLRLMNRIYTPTVGEILYKGKEATPLNFDEFRQEVHFLAQGASVYSGTIAEHLKLYVKMHKAAQPSDEQMKKALQRAHLDKSLAMSSFELSGGEKQRLLLAGVFLLPAEVYILDEPTSALDNTTERLVLSSFVQEILENGKTVIMASHDYSISREFGDKCIQVEESQAWEEDKE